jgi:hypothetical protein
LGGAPSASFLGDALAGAALVAFFFLLAFAGEASDGAAATAAFLDAFFFVGFAEVFFFEGVAMGGRKMVPGSRKYAPNARPPAVGTRL